MGRPHLPVPGVVRTGLPWGAPGWSGPRQVSGVEPFLFPAQAGGWGR